MEEEEFGYWDLEGGLGGELGYRDRGMKEVWVASFRVRLEGDLKETVPLSFKMEEKTTGKRHVGSISHPSAER